MKRVGERPESAWSIIPPFAEKPLRLKTAEADGTSVSSVEEICIASGTLRVIMDFSLVLASQNINHHIKQGEHGPWEIFVLQSALTDAEMQILLYKQENPGWEHEKVHLQVLKLSAQPIWFLLIPAVCTFIQFSNPNIEAFGIADASRILKGEWWRLFTAQTLHSGSYHLVSNLIFGFFVFSLISLKMPLTRIAPFLVLAAAFANLETAIVMGNYFSLGFSTTVFAGLGALATLEVRSGTWLGKHTPAKAADGKFGLRKISPPALWAANKAAWVAAFLLAVFVGVGDERGKVDVFGHFFGLIMGALAGFMPPKKNLQWGMAVNRIDVFIVLGMFAFFAFMWMLALRN